ncbi:MAG: beta-ketoacyl synthase N-terminal-like domain-containing protein [Azospirillaceae bacterium]
MRAPGTARIALSAAGAVRAEPDGRLAEDALVPERRVKKVGALPDKARLALAAMRRCLGPEPSVGGDRCGVALGTWFGAMDVAERCLDTVRADGFKEVTPSWYATGLPNATAAIVAAVHGITGPNLTFLGWSAGLEAIVAGCRQIAAGRCDTMIVGGFDMTSPGYAASLAADPVFAPAGAVHAGAAVLRLDRAAGAATADGGEAGPRARVIGWSQGEAGPGEDGSGEDGAGEDDAALADRLVAAACAMAARGDAAERGAAGVAPAPSVHVLTPGRVGGPDHLAASAPLHLVDLLARPPGDGPARHALVARGLGPSAVCLLIETD